jgi:hypothetical protein
MVARLVRRPFAAALCVAALCVAALCLTALAACEFLVDEFPPYLRFLEAEVDLSPSVRELGINEDFHIRILRFLRSPVSGRSLIFALGESYGGAFLLALDAKTLKPVLAINQDGIGPFLAVAPNGNFISGRLELNAQTLAVVNDTLPTGPFSDKSFGFVDGGVLNVLFPDASGLRLIQFTPTWGVSFDASAPNITDASTWSYLGDVWFDAGAAPSLRLLFEIEGGAMVLGFDSASALAGSFGAAYLENSATEAVRLNAAGAERGWLTADGAVALTHRDDTAFVRYSYATGKELDFVSDRSMDGERMSAFDPDGKRRAQYEHGSTKLRLMRTWWR